MQDEFKTDIALLKQAHKHTSDTIDEVKQSVRETQGAVSNIDKSLVIITSIMDKHNNLREDHDSLRNSHSIIEGRVKTLENYKVKAVAFGVGVIAVMYFIFPSASAFISEIIKAAG